jgi:hypothetical protein
LLLVAVLNYHPLSTQAINAENSAVEEMDSGLIPIPISIRSQWSKMASDSSFPMLIFHATQDGLMSQQYQIDMKFVLPELCGLLPMSFTMVKTDYLRVVTTSSLRIQDH